MKRIRTGIYLLLGAFVITWSLPVFGQVDSGYQITISLSEYDHDTLFLGHHYGNQQFLKDTAVRNDNDQFVFVGEKDLEGGVYLVVLKPNNNFFQLLINPGERMIEIDASNGEVPSINTISGSDDNLLFKEYVDFIQQRNPMATELRTKINTLQQKGQDISELEAQMESINKEVSTMQENLFSEHPNSLTTMLIKGSINPNVPEFEGTPQEIEMQRFRYYKKHYFDHINFNDPRILRTPFLFQKIDNYLEKLTVKVPDSINLSLDFIFSKLESNEEAYKYYLIHYLNHFAKSKFVGMDAIYVHLVDNYYAQGKAPWVDKKQLAKIVENAKRLRPLLIGQKAPDLKMRMEDGTVTSIYETKAEYVVLFFWDPDCPHCKKQMPDMTSFYNDFKSQDIKVFAICSKLNTEKEPEGGKKCWEYIKEKPEIQDWIHVSDPMHLSRYKIIYDLQSTPQIFVLDKDKIIRSKRIGAEQLPDVMEHIYLQDGKTIPEDSDPGK